VTPADLARLAAVADREIALCATEAERVAARRMAWASARKPSSVRWARATRRAARTGSATAPPLARDGGPELREDR